MTNEEAVRYLKGYANEVICRDMNGDELRAIDVVIAKNKALEERVGELEGFLGYVGSTTHELLLENKTKEG